MSDITPQLQTLFSDRLKQNEPLSKHTNFRLGGPARWFVEAKSAEEIGAAVKLAEDNGVKWFVMGGGSNILASDAGFDGLVIQVSMREYKIEGSTVVAEAGVMTGSLARATVEAGLEGLEWSVTVPGTIGGAVRGNAGCYGGEMKDVVKKVQVLRGGQVLDLSLDDLKFAYRESLIKHSKDIILSVSFELRPGDSESLKQKIEEQIRKRKASQPFYAGSAGCIFKNYEIKKDELDRLKKESDIPEEMIAKGQISTGWLVDQMDLKGKQIDGVKISDEHGNFIINLGNGRASDVVQLISIIKMQARDRFGLALEEEVEYLGF